MLVPAGILALMIFAAIAVDSAGAFLAQRQLTDALAAAANDAVTAGIDSRVYYSTGAIVLDPTVSATVVCRSLAAQGEHDLHHLHVAIGVSGGAIEVRGTAEVDAVFGRLFPHFGTRRITAEAGANARQGPGRTDPSPPILDPVPC